MSLESGEKQKSIPDYAQLKRQWFQREGGPSERFKEKNELAEEREAISRRSQYSGN